jgi:hypothetical protein
MIEIRHGHPLPGGIPAAPGTKSMDMWMKTSRLPKCLNDRDHSWTKTVFFEGGRAQELLEGLVSATGELTEKLTMVEKVNSEHLWDGKNPHGVRHVFEHFVVKESGKGRGSLGVTRGTEVPLTTGEHEQPLGTTLVTSKPCETTFRRRTVEVTSDDGVGETSPSAVGVLESVLPDGFDLFVVGFEELIQGSGSSVAGPIERRRLGSVRRDGEAHRARS